MMNKLNRENRDKGWFSGLCLGSITSCCSGRIKDQTQERAESSLGFAQQGDFYYDTQRAKKVVSDSPGLVDFAIGLVIFVLNLPDGQVLFFGEIQIAEGL